MRLDPIGHVPEMSANRVQPSRRSAFGGYNAKRNLRAKVLDFVQSGGPKWMVGGMVFEMWLGAL